MDKKKIVFLIIFTGILILSIYLFIQSYNEKNEIKDIKSQEEKVTKYGGERFEANDKGNGLSDVDEDIAKNTMKLELEIPEEIKQIIDEERLYLEFEKFLVDDDFWADVTKATSDGSITQDFIRNQVILPFELNDKAKTKVNVIIDNDSVYTFNWF